MQYFTNLDLTYFQSKIYYREGAKYFSEKDNQPKRMGGRFS